MIPKVIKNKEQYDDALAEVERLMAEDPKEGTPSGDRLALLATLLEVYEKKYYHFNLPNPIAAIRFRMEQQGLLQRDLVPYVGSKSKVSEVLAGRRPLTIQMIRSLHSGLGIPLEVLLQESAKPQCDHVTTIDWSHFPVDEMIKLGWLKSNYRKASDHANELIKAFLEPLEGRLSQAAMCRRTPTDIDIHLLLAWIARVQILAQEERHIANYEPDKISKDFLREVVRLSWFEKGPLLAQEFLAKHGIALIIERQLKGAKLDGAAMIGKRGPVIGLTLRYDRIDSFWFTLIHELVHVVKHLKNENTIYVDDLDKAFEDPIEKETDSIASDVLVPKNKWKTSRANLQKTSSAVNDLAKELGIHPAIIAGKIRFEMNNYTMLQELVGHKQVRKLFSGVRW